MRFTGLSSRDEVTLEDTGQFIRKQLITIERPPTSPLLRFEARDRSLHRIETRLLRSIHAFLGVAKRQG
jgi:hypothetical protein